MSGITKADLMEYVKVTEDQLKQKCSDEHIREIALNLTSWELYAPYLGLSTAEIDGIKEDAHKHEQRTLRTLQKWKSKAVFKATYGALVDVCIKLRNAELAEKICQYAKGMSCMMCVFTMKLMWVCLFTLCTEKVATVPDGGASYTTAASAPPKRSRINGKLDTLSNHVPFSCGIHIISIRYNISLTMIVCWFRFNFELATNYSSISTDMSYLL